MLYFVPHERVRNISLFKCTSISYGIIPALFACCSSERGDFFSSLMNITSWLSFTSTSEISIVVRFIETRPMIGHTTSFTQTIPTPDNRLSIPSWYPIGSTPIFIGFSALYVPSYPTLSPVCISFIWISFVIQRSAGNKCS